MNDAKCAHKKILGKVTEPDTNGYVKGYWICGDCGTEMKVEPLSREEQLKAEIESLEKELSRIRLAIRTTTPPPKP